MSTRYASLDLVPDNGGFRSRRDYINVHDIEGAIPKYVHGVNTICL